MEGEGETVGGVRPSAPPLEGEVDGGEEGEPGFGGGAAAQRQQQQQYRQQYQQQQHYRDDGVERRQVHYPDLVGEPGAAQPQHQHQQHGEPGDVHDGRHHHVHHHHHHHHHHAHAHEEADPDVYRAHRGRQQLYMEYAGKERVVEHTHTHAPPPPPGSPTATTPSSPSPYLGAALVALAWLALIASERSANRRDSALVRASKSAVALGSPQSARCDLDGRLVCLTHKVRPLEAQDGLELDDGVVAQGALRARRQVEVFQWKQIVRSSSSSSGSSTTRVTDYSVEKVWSTSLIDSSAFRVDVEPANPRFKRIADAARAVDRAAFGPYYLTGRQVERLDAFEPLPVGPQAVHRLGEQLGGECNVVRVSQHELFVGAGSPERPHIGDCRVQYSQVKPLVATVMATQRSDLTFGADKTHGLELVRLGRLSPADMVRGNLSSSNALRWLVRAFVFGLHSAGLYSLLPFAAELALPAVDTLGEVGAVSTASAALLLLLVKVL